MFNKSKIGNTLLRPTKIYSEIITKIRDRLKGCAHITGGGITENLSRILPDGRSALIKIDSWKRQNIFKLIQDKANLSDQDMLGTFNCGIGMIIVVDKKNKDSVIKDCDKLNYKIFEIGNITKESRSKIIYE